MDSLALWIIGMDKVIFAWMRSTFGGEWVDPMSVFLSNFFFWSPFVAFLVVAVLAAPRQKVAVLNLLYCLGALVLAYQASFMITQLVGQPAPYVVDMILGRSGLPASPPQGYVFSNYDFSFPDWETASLAALVFFSRRRLRDFGIRLSPWIWISLLGLGAIRIVAGHAYPLDIMAGFILGRMVGWIMIVFARNMDMVLNPPAAETPSTLKVESPVPAEKEEEKPS